MIDSASLAPSSSACSLLRALSFPSLYAVGIETPRIPSRQYTISSSSVVMRFSAYLSRLGVVNSSKEQLRNTRSGILVVS